MNKVYNLYRIKANYRSLNFISTRLCALSPFKLQSLPQRSYSQYHYVRFNQPQGYNSNWEKYWSDPTFKRWCYITVGAGSLFYVTHLEKAPITERKRFIWLPRSWELRVGQYTYNSILRETKPYILPRSHPTTKRVEKVFHRIVQAASQDSEVDQSLINDINWQIHVVNDPRQPPNAFVLPSGKVFVYSNILGICGNDDGLATVLAHEFAHQLARHTSENLSKAPIYSFVSIAVYLLTGIQGINNLLTDSILRMPASRQMETEADYIGLMTMARACYNPNESVKVWERMSNYEKRSIGRGQPLEFLSTHPASERRINNMNKWIPKAREIFEQNDCHVYDTLYKGFQNNWNW